MWLASRVHCKSYHVSCKAQVWWSFKMEVFRKDVSPHVTPKKTMCASNFWTYKVSPTHFGILPPLTRQLLVPRFVASFYRAGKPGTITLIVVFHHRYTNSNGFYNWNNMSSHIWHLINPNWYNKWKGTVIAPAFLHSILEVRTTFQASSSYHRSAGNLLPSPTWAART